MIFIPNHGRKGCRWAQFRTRFSLSFKCSRIDIACELIADSVETGGNPCVVQAGIAHVSSRIPREFCGPILPGRSAQRTRLSRDPGVFDSAEAVWQVNFPSFGLPYLLKVQLSCSNPGELQEIILTSRTDSAPHDLICWALLVLVLATIAHGMFITRVPSLVTLASASLVHWQCVFIPRPLPAFSICEVKHMTDIWWWAWLEKELWCGGPHSSRDSGSAWKPAPHVDTFLGYIGGGALWQACKAHENFNLNYIHRLISATPLEYTVQEDNSSDSE